MGFGPAYGGSGSSSLIVATRSDTSNPAVFADFATLEIYTATQSGIADANRINVASSEFARQVFAVGTLSGSNQVTALTAAYIRLSGEWVAVATNLVGTAGTAGTDGVDGNNYEFIDIASRDTFFAARPDLLVNGLPIMVNLGDSTVTPLVWDGPTNPPSYNALTDSVIWNPASLRVGTSSFELGGVHTISSGGENVFFRNEVNGTSYFPPWQSVGDHSTVEGQTVENIPTHRVYQDLEMVEPRGAVAAAGAVEYNVTATLTENVAAFGLRFVPAENYTGEYEYRVTETATGIIVYSQTQIDTVVDGEELIFWFDYPVDGLIGDSVRTEVIKPDGTRGLSRPTVDDANSPYIEVRQRLFTDVPLASSTDVANADWDETDTSDPSYIANKPTLPTPRTDEQIRSVVVALLQEGDNITLQEDDANDTLTISATSAAVFQSPTITTFNIAGQATEVAIGTVIGGPGNLDYAVANSENVAGTLTLTQRVDGAAATTLATDISPTATLASIVTSDVTIAAGQSIIWTLSGLDTQNQAFSRTFTVTVIENLYHGLSSSDNAATIDLTGLTAIPVQQNDQHTIQTGVTTADQYFIILVPTDRDITSIIDTVLSQNVTDIFTRGANARTEADGVAYHSYTIGPLTAGSNESYIVRL